MNGFGTLRLALPALVAWLAGCSGPTVQFTYDRPAEYDIAPSVRRLAVAEFGGKTYEDRKWGDIASDRLAGALDTYNRQYNRYELVDRKRLQGILDERDLQIAISDAASAAQAGKLAKVDAMIYGTGQVAKDTDRVMRTGFDPVSRRPTKTWHERLYCMAAVSFTMDDVETSKTLAAVSVTREFDSDKSDKNSKAKAFVRAMGFSGSGPPPADQVVHGLIDECVDAFLAKISPHRVEVTEKLERGKSEAVATGNKLAKAGEWAEALECYRRGMQADASDDGAVFNAGVMYEATGDYAQAEAHYDRAVRMNPKENYILARSRVRSAAE